MTVADDSNKKSIESNTAQKNDYQTLYSRNKQATNTPNPKAQEEKI